MTTNHEDPPDRSLKITLEQVMAELARRGMVALKHGAFTGTLALAGLATATNLAGSLLLPAQALAAIKIRLSATMHDAPESLQRELRALADDVAVPGDDDLRRARQRRRFGRSPLAENARMNGRQVRRFCVVDGAAATLLREALDRLHLSARVYDRLLRLARTIADLADSPVVDVAHVREAIHYREPVLPGCPCASAS